MESLLKFSPVTLHLSPATRILNENPELIIDKIIENNFLWVYLLLSAMEMMSKCSKPKWNHKPQASGFTAKLAAFLRLVTALSM